MKEKKRVLFVTDTFGYGGAEKQLAFVAEGLLQRGYFVGICNLNQGKRGEGERIVSKDIEMFVADIPYCNAIKSNYDYVAFVCKTARWFKPNIIVGFKELANFCSVVTGKITGIPSVISERADPFRAYSKAVFSTRVKLWVINHATAGVFQTEKAASFYEKRLKKNSVIIPNPVFIKEKIPNIDYSNLPPTVVSLGRLDNKQKRLDIMLEAFCSFHKRHPEFVLKIYGNGEDEVLVKQWIIEKKLTSSVLLMGVSDNPMRDLSKGGIFLITSDFEGISNSLLEAMACGLPVVSTDHSPGGARLLIKNGENGLLVPVRDPDAISTALCQYAENHFLAKHCGTNAKKVLDSFSPKSILDRWENVMKKVSK